MRWLRLCVRLLRIALAVGVALVIYAWRRVLRWRVSAEESERLQGETIAALLQRLGATFIKLGQIFSTRPDLLGPGFIEPLSRLQDAVPAAPFSEIDLVVGEELGPEARAQISAIDPVPVAAASVAQVHRATLTSGETIALKVQRLLARDQIERDLAILGFVARLLDRLPALAMLSLPGSVERFGVALRGQLDFARRPTTTVASPKLRKRRRHLGPCALPELCSSRVLAMEFIDGVKATEPKRSAATAAVWPGSVASACSR
jgi:ubiquinone biosynthesis protein